MATMRANDHEAVSGAAHRDPVDQGRAELLRRIDEMWERRHELEVEPSPGIKELVDSQDEYRERVKARIRRLTGR